MIVPGGNGRNAMLDQQVAQEQMPSQTDMLMALGQMHREGRLQVAGNVVKFPGLAASPAGHLKDIEDDPKARTREVLGRALGAGKVLPMTPKDKE